MKHTLVATAILASLSSMLFGGQEAEPPRGEKAAIEPAGVSAPVTLRERGEIVLEAYTLDRLIFVEPEPETPAGELLSPSGLSGEELEHGLIGALKPYAQEFLKAEEETGVNAVFLAAVAAYESGWNSSALARNRNNLFGWTSSSGYRSFDSVETCIAAVSEKLRTNYLSPDGCYFHGYTVEAVNVRYNGNAHWEATVRQIMREISRRADKYEAAVPCAG